MSYFIYKNNEVHFEYNGIKIINCDNPCLFIREISQSTIELNNRRYKNFIVISDLTKIKDLISLSKNSPLFEKILEIKEDKNFITEELIEKIINDVNEYIGFPLISSNDGDTKKLIDLLFELDDDQFIHKEFLEFYFKKYFIDDKSLVIINDLSFVDLNFLTRFMNWIDIIVVTNDFRKYLTNDPKSIEALLVLDDYNYFDVIDKDKFINYIELKCNFILNNELWINIINHKNSLDSIKFLSFTKSAAEKNL